MFAITLKSKNLMTYILTFLRRGERSSLKQKQIVIHFINFILKRTEGGTAVDVIITLLTCSTAENHNFTQAY